MRKFLLITCSILCLIVAFLVNVNDGLRAEKHRLSENQDALMKDIEFYKTEAGQSAASVKRLLFDYDELEKYNKDLCKIAEDLDIKVKRLEAASKTATRSDLEIKTRIRDTIIIKDTAYVNIKTFDWHDPWTDVYGNIFPDDNLVMNVATRDTIRQIIHRVPKKFLWFRWGTKAIRQEIVTSNPHSTIEYTEYIELK